MVSDIRTAVAVVEEAIPDKQKQTKSFGKGLGTRRKLNEEPNSEKRKRTLNLDPEWKTFVCSIPKDLISAWCLKQF